MKIQWFVFLLCWLAGQAVAQSLPGRIVDGQSAKPIPAATILNQNTRRVSISGEEGAFRTVASPGDILRVTCVGYQEMRYVVPDTVQELRIALRPQTVQLQEVTVRGVGGDPFDPNFLKEKVPEKPSIQLGTPPELQGVQLTKDVRVSSDPVSKVPVITITGPFTLAYNTFSRKARSDRKLKKLIEENRRRKIFNARLNPAWVVRITDLTDDELEPFIDYCAFSEEFVLTATEYELIRAVQKKVPQFRGNHAQP